MKRVSLETISKELGVSKTLISFVLNGKAEEMKISPIMVEKVLKKVKELNYKGNPMARALRTGKSNTIGLIVADISNSFYSRLARSIEDEASKNKYHVIFGSSDENDKKSSELINLFYDRRIDGLIISPTRGDMDNLVSLQNRGFPIVLLDRYFLNVKSNIVVANNLGGAYDIVKRLIKRGNRKIGYVTHRTRSSVVELRFKGYIKALKEFEIELDNNIIKNVEHANNKEEIRMVVKDMIENNDIDAIFFFSNVLALEGGRIVRDFNRKVKKNIDIGCFDSSSHLELLEIPFISAVQQVEELGRMSMELLLLQIKSDSQINQKRVVKAKLVDMLK